MACCRLQLFEPNGKFFRIVRFFLHSVLFCPKFAPSPGTGGRQNNQIQHPMSTTKPANGPAHLAKLRAKGWTLRPAARLLGVSTTHLHAVLSGHRYSRSLLSRIAELPANREP